MERFKLGDGRFLLIHGKKECAGRNCVIHNPSTHPLSKAPLKWREDRGIMERICEHGIGHPDPDDLAYKEMILGDHYSAFQFGIHGCDGCCMGEDYEDND